VKSAGGNGPHASYATLKAVGAPGSMPRQSGLHRRFLPKRSTPIEAQQQYGMTRTAVWAAAAAPRVRSATGLDVSAAPEGAVLVWGADGVIARCAIRHVHV